MYFEREDQKRSDPVFLYSSLQSDIMDPALRAQSNAAVQQQVREVAEEAVLKMQNIVDTRKRSAYDSFRDTRADCYAQHAAMNRMSSSCSQPPLQQAVVLQHGPQEQAPSRPEKRIKPVFLRALV